MNLFFRMLWVIVTALLSRRQLAPLDVSELTFRVLPNDLDINLHINNGRYLTIADLGRIDMMLRTGMVRTLVRQRWAPILGGATVRFRRSLLPFQRYRLKTRLLCWDAKWVYMEHVFETMDGELAAVVWVKGLFKAGSRTVPTSDVLKAMGRHDDSPPMPPEVFAWQTAEQAMAESARAA